MKAAPHERLKEYWESTKSDFAITRQSEKTVASLEAKHGIEFPPDFRTYLLEGYHSENNANYDLLEWWAIGSIKNIPEAWDGIYENANFCKDAQYYIFFADFFAWAWAWAICCKPGENYGRILQVFGDDNDRLIANSFSYFVDDIIGGKHQ